MPNKDFDKIDPKHNIIIKGARVHNLKNIDVAIPRNKLIVITGVSGSGKSSLAFDTIFAEGQRRYVESLSSYARQFLGRMQKPEVDYIKGLSPAIAIEQKVNIKNSRSTVGTSTEIYDYLKLLFARIGKTISPKSGNEVKRDTVTDVVNFVTNLNEGTKLVLYSKLQPAPGRSIADELAILIQLGFSRALVNNEQARLEDLIESPPKNDILILIDRFVSTKDDESNNSRISDSVQTAFYEGKGECILQVYHDNSSETEHTFSNKFELDGIKFEEPTVNLFTFNNPYGACKKCDGFGSVVGLDEDLVIPDKRLSVFDNVVAPWRSDKMSEWKDQLINKASKTDFPIHRPYLELSSAEKDDLWYGTDYYRGILDFFKFVEEESYKIQYRVMLSRYRGKTFCPDCKGTRLRKDANYVIAGGKSISDIVLLQAADALTFFENIKLSETDAKIADRLLKEITSRLAFLKNVGLGYLSLNRLSSTLSGGESQRINLATSLGSSLVGSMYILDEPSIGLHPKDTENLITVIKSLRDIGNTVIVVEHDEEMMLAADQIIDVGPLAGTLGGEIVFQGDHAAILKDEKSLTNKYLTKKLVIEVPKTRRSIRNKIEIKGAQHHNLKGIDVTIPLNTLTVVTGVSGSGKTSLIKDILYPAVSKQLGNYIATKTGSFEALTGDFSSIANIEFIDQNPIGKSSRSNPVTYVKAYDEIRGLYSELAGSKIHGLKPSSFSFNVPGGRCEACEGEGEVKVEMQFMADVHLTCEECRGLRFRDEVLEVTHNDKNIADLLNLTIDEAIEFFKIESSDATLIKGQKKIINKLKPLQDVGLGYVKLGQSSSTLSGGEAQRVKLAYFLSKGKTEKTTLFIFDEPTTGLHFHDINKLLKAFNALIANGHSIVVIEHNLDVIKTADWIIDLGPTGGEKGGYLLGQGTPEELVKNKKSITGKYLKLL